MRNNHFYEEIRIPGMTQSENRAELSFGVSGTVNTVLVDIGSQLNAGDVLATLDLEPYQLALTRARLEATKAKTTFDEYRANFDRLNRLRESNAVSQQDLEASRALFLNAQASLQEVQARIRLAERDLEQAVIKAPYDGVVSSRKIEPFEEVTQSQVAFTFDSSEKMIVESSIPTNLAMRIRQAQSHEASINYQGTFLKAVVSHIGERANNGLSVPIKLSLIEPAVMGLMQGVVVEVIFRFQNNVEQAVFLPHGAISVDPTNNTTFVYTYEGQTQTVHKRLVSIIDIQSEGYWVNSDLTLGEKYVDAGATYLKDGQHVHDLGGKR